RQRARLAQIVGWFVRFMAFCVDELKNRPSFGHVSECEVNIYSKPPNFPSTFLKKLLTGRFQRLRYFYYLYTLN
ncbi:MAG: hypothetical protein K2O46_04795, partial [Bacteroidales bacterium]|nr:hypothetical protein [Bacteroidales bacterium]